MSAKQISLCKCCGAKMVEYTHTLNHSMVESLYYFYKNNPPLNLNKIKELSFSMRTNFQKLRYWDLIEKVYDKNTRIEGSWNITHKGILFLYNKIKVPKQVVTYRNKRVRFKDDLCFASDLWQDLVTNNNFYNMNPETQLNNNQLSLFG